jgi:predicted negative regulator of RcsB-dependent stress response
LINLPTNSAIFFSQWKTMMAVYDLEEQEQLDELKTWWKQYGNLATSAMLVVAVAASGWQGWNWWQRNQSAQASVVYASLQQAATQRDGKRTRELAGELIDKYSGSSYAGMAALASARVQIDSGDVKTAQLQLNWAADHANDPGLRELARLRLAVVLIDEKAFDEAAKQLAIEPTGPFLARHSEIKGDLYAAQGKLTEARAAYEVALNKLESGARTGAKDELADNASKGRSGYHDVLRTKSDLLGLGAAK